MARNAVAPGRADANPLAPAWLPVPADANALTPGLWPQSAVRNAAGELAIGGVTADELSATFGTPLYVIDEADVRRRAAETLAAFRAAFEPLGVGVRVYYAGKAFLCVQVAQWMSQAGLNIDVCTGGELAVALAASVAPSRLGLHGNNKSLTEIDAAVAAGVGAIVIDGFAEIDRVAETAVRHARVQNVRLRVNSGVHAHTHEFLATAHEDQKFGVSLEDAPEAVRRIRAHAGLNFLGLHGHIGSQIFGSDGFAEAAARLLRVHAELCAAGPVPELNLGGGFGIAYTSADSTARIGEIASGIADAVAAECAALGIPVPDLAFEPGRAIIGPGGVTLYRAGTVKDVTVTVGADSGHAEADARAPSAVRRYVSVDGGMSDNVRTALYGADYAVRIASRVSEAAPALVRIAGKHCESGDIVVGADYLPGDVTAGDLLAVPATGAYCWSLSSNYNYLGRPPVVAVIDGKARVIVRGVTEADLLALNVALTGENAPTAAHDKDHDA